MVEKVMCVTELQADLEIERSDSGSLKTALVATESELSRVRKAAQNTLSIADENDRLKARVNELIQNESMLSKENADLKDSSNMDWFIRGAGVSVIAFLLGIVITRIRWRKKDSWGSY
jgi:SH3 domain protein